MLSLLRTILYNFDLIDFLNTYPAQVSEEREGKREGEREYRLL